MKQQITLQLRTVDAQRKYNGFTPDTSKAKRQVTLRQKNERFEKKHYQICTYFPTTSRLSVHECAQQTIKHFMTI